METLWPLVFQFCDIITAKAFIQSRSFDMIRIIRKQLRGRCSDMIKRFLRDVHAGAPWRAADPLCLQDRYDMRWYLRVRDSPFGQRYYRRRLMKYYLQDKQYGSTLYLFGFQSSNANVEREREAIRENYAGSRYDLARYVMTLTKEEIIRHGI